MHLNKRHGRLHSPSSYGDEENDMFDSNMTFIVCFTKSVS
jgi:hypothetical protein